VDERIEYLPGVPCWVDLMEPDPAAATTFYGGLFGWEFEDQAPPGSPGPYNIARLHGKAVAAVGGPPAGAAPVAWNTYVRVESADAAVDEVRAANGTVLQAPMDIPGAGRMAVFADREGAALSVWEPNEFRGAELVNDAGSWVYSDLMTRDRPGAASFYGSVFGWNVDDLVFDGSGFTIFTVTGYGDFLAERKPELAEWRAHDERAARYADAVAMIRDLDADHAATPAHWAVTFSTDDPDGTAARAEQLGGTVIVPPFDAPPVRAAVLADPQGAVFTVSRYQPSDDA
jgi:predicted enzyme related to lactoylglutathione lyase